MVLLSRLIEIKSFASDLDMWGDIVSNQMILLLRFIEIQSFVVLFIKTKEYFVYRGGLPIQYNHRFMCYYYLKLLGKSW